MDDLIKLPGDGDVADGLIGELLEGRGGEVEVVFCAGVALVFDNSGDALAVV